MHFIQNVYNKPKKEIIIYFNCSHFYFYPRHNMLSQVSFAKCKIYNIQAYIGTLPDSSAKRVG